MSSALSAHDKRRYRVELEALTNRLFGTAARLEAEATHPTGPEGTSADAPTQEPTSTSTEGEEEVALAAVQAEERILAEAQAALARIEQGTFGRCEQCGRGISKARLDAIPYARCCIRCAGAATDV